jgi:hypothetical protein
MPCNVPSLARCWAEDCQLVWWWLFCAGRVSEVGLCRAWWIVGWFGVRLGGQVLKVVRSGGVASVVGEGVVTHLCCGGHMVWCRSRVNSLRVMKKRGRRVCEPGTVASLLVPCCVVLSSLGRMKVPEERHLLTGLFASIGHYGPEPGFRRGGCRDSVQEPHGGGI